MVLKASDELRHQWNDDHAWRESLYFNFADPVNEIGAWLYMWVLPNQEQKSGMLVCFYHGVTERFDGIAAAMQSPGHILEEDGRWVYCFTKNFPELVEADFDDISLGGLTYKRGEPLKTYALSYADDAGNGFNLDAEFLTIPYDYADGPHPTPEWVAANRYHRSWRARGELRVGGRDYAIDTTGDSDHSWGKRDHAVFMLNNFKMWSFQMPDKNMSISAIAQGTPGAETPLGFVSVDSDLQGIRAIRESADYSETGQQTNVRIEAEDAKGRTVSGRLDRMFAGIALGAPDTGGWGFEGVGHYDVESFGRCTGITSTFFAAGTKQSEAK